MLESGPSHGITYPNALQNHLSGRHRLIARATVFWERRPWAAIALIVLIYLPSAFENSRKTLLWHDELFTYWIAQAPSLRVLWDDLRTLDLNPPLGYLLTRLSFHLFGVNTLATRLPEIVGFLVALIAIFQFVRHRLGVLYALLCAFLLMESPIAELSVEARPYALMLAGLGIALVGWQRATERQGSRKTALTMLFCGATGMLLSHIFSLLGMAALIAAEFFRQYRRRARDLPVLLALLLPLTVVASYIPMLRSHGGSIFPTSFQPDLDRMFLFYLNSMDHELLAVGLSSSAVLILLGRRSFSGLSRKPKEWFLPAQEWVLLVGLLLAPLALMIELMLTHGAFFDRYGAAEAFAVAVLLCVLLARITFSGGKVDPRPALLATVIVILMTRDWLALPRQILQHQLIPTAANSEPEQEPCEACRNTEAIDPTLPLVDASGLTFVEMNHREAPATLSRIFYLTDEAASKEFAHANIFEHMSLVVERFHLAGHTENYHSFLSAHPHFFVLGTFDHPEDWLLRKLSADRADIRVLDQVDDSYVNREVYEVKIEPAKH